MRHVYSRFQIFKLLHVNVSCLPSVQLCKCNVWQCWMIVCTLYKLISNIKKHKHKQICYRDYKKFDTEIFLNPAIVNSDFNDVELRDKWNTFKLAFISICEKLAPVKTMRVKERYYPWVNADIVKLMYERNHAKKCAVKSKRDLLWDRYKHLRNQITIKIRTAKNEYYEQKLAECGNNSKKLWKCLNKITGNTISKPPHKDLDCNAFNEYFSTIGEKITSQMSG